MQSLSSLITKLLKQSLHKYQRGDEIMMMTIFPALYRKGGQRWYVVCENSEILLCCRAGWFQLKNHILNHSFIQPFIYSFMHAQSCLTFGDPLNSSGVLLRDPGLLCPWIFQARVLEWVPFCLLHPLHWQAESLPLSHMGSPSYPLNLYQLSSFCVSTLHLRLFLPKKQKTYLGSSAGLIIKLA